MLKISCVLVCGFVLLVAGCSGTREIETASPRPLSTPGNVRAEALGMGQLSIDLETGASGLPDEVQALRFRIEEIQLHTDEGEWITFPTELNSFEILPDRYLYKTILSTRVMPVLYDSLALKISNAFVLFGENAGGPLSLPRDNPVKVAVNIKPEVGQASQVSITIEPGASLFRDQQCRWYFVPFWTTGEE